MIVLVHWSNCNFIIKQHQRSDSYMRCSCSLCNLMTTSDWARMPHLGRYTTTVWECDYEHWLICFRNIMKINTKINKVTDVSNRCEFTSPSVGTTNTTFCFKIITVHQLCLMLIEQHNMRIIDLYRTQKNQESKNLAC